MRDKIDTGSAGCGTELTQIYHSGLFYFSNTFLQNTKTDD
jgi:hypothetical protein